MAKMKTKYKTYYFLGVGGIGMSALARYFKKKGAKVAGYDRNRSELCAQLEAEGIEIHYEDNTEKIPTYAHDVKNTLVVYTPAIPKEHGERKWLEEKGYKMMKRAEVLGLITRNQKGLCVAGTHGKTTTTNMIANIMSRTRKGCSAFLGGISNNFGTNLLISDKSDKVVIEADEFDRSFLNLRPWIAVITSADADHLDIYGTEEEYRNAFSEFSSLVQTYGALIVKRGVKVKIKQKKGVRVYSYGGAVGLVKNKPDFYAEYVRKTKQGEIVFNFVSPRGVIRRVPLGVPVLINVEDAVAACAVAQLCGARDEEIRLGIGTFRGTHRRFERHGDFLIDDYAHHPEEIAATLDSVRYLYPKKKICCVFQPHLYSRTRDLADGFGKALSKADDVLLLPIYPAREVPIEGVSSEMLLGKIEHEKKVVVEKNNLIKELDNHDFDMLLTLGAGDIDLMIPELRTYLEERNKKK